MRLPARDPIGYPRRVPRLARARMTAFLESLLALPTVLFTGALGLALLYWSLVFLGALDIDFLDVDVDVDVDGLTDGALDGAVEGALDGGADSADALDGGDSASVGALARLLGALRVRDVPVTVSLSFMTLFAWVLSWLLVRLAGPLAPAAVPAVAVGAVFALIAVAIAVPAGRLAVRPLSGLFHTEQGARRSDLIGQTVEIATGRVDRRFGQAELSTDGADLLVQVRADPAVALARGEQALIVSWDPQADAFVVEPLRAPGAAAATRTADRAADRSSPAAAAAADRARDPDPA
jgi:hypothetical protein